MRFAAAWSACMTVSPTRSTAASIALSGTRKLAEIRPIERRGVVAHRGVASRAHVVDDPPHHLVGAQIGPECGLDGRPHRIRQRPRVDQQPPAAHQQRLARRARGRKASDDARSSHGAEGYPDRQHVAPHGSLGAMGGAALVIPAWNEADAIGAVLSEIPSGVFDAILVVVGGADDPTASVAARLRRNGAPPTRPRLWRRVCHGRLGCARRQYGARRVHRRRLR